MSSKYSSSHIKILEESSCREFDKYTSRCYFLHERMENKSILPADGKEKRKAEK